MNNIQTVIFRTIIYYDIIGMAPSGFEVWANLIGIADEKFSLGEVLKELDNLCAQDKLGQKWGFFFLPGKQNLSKERLDNLNYCDQKWKKARKAFSLLAAVPYIRMIFASGSFALGNTTKDSDIDVLIVLKNGRIWTGRFFATVLTHVMKKRRHGRKIADRICLNHFITDSSLRIPFESLYNAHIYSNLVPIFAVRGADPKNFLRSNRWIKRFIGATTENDDRLSGHEIHPDRFFILIGTCFEILLNTYVGDIAERFFRALQLKRILNNPLTYKDNGHVVADDTMLAFHPDSPEEEIIMKYNKKLFDLGISQAG